MSDAEETLLNDSEAWRKEAQAVMDDVKIGVREILVSERLSSKNSQIFLNVRTLEDEAFCIELTSRGFRVAGKAYDTNDIREGPYYETPYSLLERHSPMFREEFGKKLAEKLGALLADGRESAEESDS